MELQTGDQVTVSFVAKIWSKTERITGETSYVLSINDPVRDTNHFIPVDDNQMHVDGWLKCKLEKAMCCEDLV